MIALRLDEIAAVVGGTVTGDGSTLVTAPAVIKSGDARPGGLFVAFAGERVDGHEFAADAGKSGAVAVLGTRPTVLPTIVVEDAAVALQSLAIHVLGRLRQGVKVVGLTGSQGKTSTKDLLTAVLAAEASTVATAGNLNNELGVPLTVLRADEHTRFLVIEMGARHIGDIALLTSIAPPDVSVVLNVGHAHLGEFGSRDAIATAKGELVQGLTAGGTAVLNLDDERVLGMRALTGGPVTTFGFGAGADVRVADLVLDGLGRPTFTLETADAAASVTLPILGAHQAGNAAAAAGAALALGLTLPDIAASLGQVALSRWRMELHDLAGGAKLINDSYNASPGSTRAALDALAAVDGARHIAVIGEILELGEASAEEHRTVGEYAIDRADIVLAIGANTRPVADGAGAKGIAVADNAAAIEWLRSELGHGDVVLLKASRGSRLDEVAAALV